VLVVNVPIPDDDEYTSTSTATATTPHEYELLYRELQLSGQLFETSIFQQYLLQGKWKPPSEL
jgi:hypothetical protein